MTYTHYDYLELPPGAPPARIEAAYSRLLERFGYGRSEAGQDLSGLVRMIHAAYDVLHDDASRAAYDRALAEEAAKADVELKSELDGLAPRFTRRVQNIPEPLNAAFNSLAA